MKVTALGTHSAFATGAFKESIDTKYIKELIEKTQTKEDKAIAISEIEKMVSEHKEKVYAPRFQSNFLLEFETKGKIKDHVYRFVIDFGGDIRHSLANVGLKMGDIDGYYCSHHHADHIGGVEGIALSTIFNPYWNSRKLEWLRKPGTDPNDKTLDNILDRLFRKESLPNDCKPDLWGHREVLENLWESARPGLDTLQGVKRVALDTFYNPVPMVKDIEYDMEDGRRTWRFYTIESTHVIGGTSHMPSYGLIFECTDGQKVYFPTDTLLMMPPTMRAFYESATVIYQDCETGIRSGVHSHIDDIRKCEPEVKKKCFLYHYTEEPVVDPDEFRGILRIGDVHMY